MSFLIYVISALIFLAAMLYGSMLGHVAQQWIGLATAVLLSLSALGSVTATRERARSRMLAAATGTRTPLVRR